MMNGDCCLRDHMRAKAPWTCQCPCHDRPQEYGCCDADFGEHTLTCSNATLKDYRREIIELQERVQTLEKKVDSI